MKTLIPTPTKGKTEGKNDTDDPYPWLDKDDPRRFKTDEQLIRELVDLKDSLLTKNKRKN